MSATLIMAAALAAQSSVSVPGPNIPVIELKEVAYDALTRGDAEAAKTKLETQLEQDPGDPATLINLGSAYARLGQTGEAEAAYLAAADSATSYRLELEGGRWMESRRAALLALRALDRPQTLAMR